MAKLLQFDRKHFSIEQLIPLKRGDDWSLEAQLLEKKGNYSEPMNLDGKAATAFFPGDTAPVTVIPAITSADCGKVRIDLAASATLLTELAENGTSLYVTVANLDGSELETIETEQEVAQIQDRAFRTF